MSADKRSLTHTESTTQGGPAKRPRLDQEATGGVASEKISEEYVTRMYDILLAHIPPLQGVEQPVDAPPVDQNPVGQPEPVETARVASHQVREAVNVPHSEPHAPSKKTHAPPQINRGECVGEDDEGTGDEDDEDSLEGGEEEEDWTGEEEAEELSGREGDDELQGGEEEEGLDQHWLDPRIGGGSPASQTLTSDEGEDF